MWCSQLLPQLAAFHERSGPNPVFLGVSEHPGPSLPFGPACRLAAPMIVPPTAHQDAEPSAQPGCDLGVVAGFLDHWAEPDQGRHRDSLTVVQDARGRPLTKSFQRLGGRTVKSSYPNVAEVIAAEVPVDGIESLAAALDSVTAGGIAAVIRGAPGKFYPRDGSPAFRLMQPQERLACAKSGARISQQRIRNHHLEPDEEHRYAVTWLPTFEDCPRRWVIFDVDRVPVPEPMAGDWVDEPHAAVEHVVGLLPEPFRLATCWWSLSSSAAVPGAAGREVAKAFKLKLAFWLDQPLTGTEISPRDHISPRCRLRSRRARVVGAA